MNPFNHLIELGFIFSFGISLVAGLYQLFYFHSAISRWCGCLLIGISINLACYYLLFTNLIPEIGRLLVVLQVAGYLLLALSFMVFIIYFTGHPKWVSNLTMVFLTLIPFVILLLMIFQWGNISSSLISKAAAFGVNTNIFKPPFGVVEGLFIAYANLVAFSSILFLFIMLFNISNLYHKTIWLLLCGAITIETAGMIEIIGANPFNGVSILQLAVALNTIPIILIVFTWKSVNSIPISQQLFKDSMRDGYLIIDSENRLVDFNPSIRPILGESTKIEIGQYVREISPSLFSFLEPILKQKLNPRVPFLFSGKDLIYETMVYPIGAEQNENLGRMVVFHNVTDRDQMEDTLRTNNMELSRTNTFFSALANLTVSLQTAEDSTIFLDTLGNELLRLGLKCFVALYQPDSKELKVMHVSESIETIRVIEKVLGRKLFGFELDRNHFNSLYNVLETRHIHYFPDEKSGLQVFLGNLPGWIMDPLVKASAVMREEASMLIPLIAADKVIGMIGVWGVNLRKEDVMPFQIFGSQLGWAIEKANLQKNDAQRLEELSHANGIITALSKVSSLIEDTSENDTALNSLGDELAKIKLSCAIVTLDRQKTVATVRYVSFQTGTLQKVEQITGTRFVGREVPQKYWPSKKATHEGIPVWFDDPVKILLGLFPGIPRGLSLQLQSILNNIQTGKLCFVPLRVQGDVIGVMPIWGPNLSHGDDAALSIFGDQVAAILRRNTSYENEKRMAGEMARSNSMILALSQVASQMDSTSDMYQVLDTLGRELKKVNMSCMVGTFDDTKQVMKVEYLTFMEDTKRIAQKFGMHWQEEMKIPRHLWPTEQAITEKAPTWDPAPIGNAYRMFPYIPKDIFVKAMRLVGWDLTEPVCYLPMINNEDVIGILSVWGKGLRQVDVPALSIFANQVATAIKNTRIYMNAQNEISERTQAEIRIREALTEKEVLLKEVHHRVKNNLQVISSLLNLQAAEVTDPNTLITLRESQNRVRSMALIHEKLYQSNDLAHIDFSTYLQSLVYSLAQSYRVQANKVDIQVQAEKIFLDLDTAIPCGLMVNELVSNSIKYAFPNDRSGKILVSFSSASHNRYSLAVSDDGIGLPPGFDFTNSSSLGLKLVNSLVRQIDAEFILDGTKGSRFEVNFSKPETV